MTTGQIIYEKALKSPEQLAKEILDFIGYIDYIEMKHGLKDTWPDELMKAQEPVWTKSGVTAKMMCGMTYNPRDIVGLPFPFSDMVSQKRRLVLVLTQADFREDFMGSAATT